MRWTLLVISAALVVAGAFVAGRVTTPSRLAPAAASSAPADQTALAKSIRAYLLANPEVLVEAMQELERKQDSQRDAAAQNVIQDKQTELFRDADDPIGGNPNGDVVIVDFNDYQCPYCKRTHQAIKSVVGADGRVKIIYKDLPILGEASKVAALAALAAVKQGKHLAMHNALMEYTGERARRARHARLRDRQAIRARRRRCRDPEAADRRRTKEPRLSGRRRASVRKVTDRPHSCC